MKYFNMLNITRFPFPMLFLIGALMCHSSGCQKDAPEPQLPPATQEGANTFGCRVNGEIWIPETNWYDGLRGIHRLSGSYDRGTVGVTAKRRVDELDQSISLGVLKGVFSKGTYTLSDRSGPAIGGGTHSDLEASCYFYTDSMHTGILTITKLDTVKGIMAGSFEFTAPYSEGSGECNNMVVITDGRFDINYKNN